MTEAGSLESLKVEERNMGGPKLASWLKSLKAGDLVAIFSDYRHEQIIHTATVLRVTKGDKLRLSTGGLYKRDGTRVGGGVYNARVIGPLPEDGEDEQ